MHRVILAVSITMLSATTMLAASPGNRTTPIANQVVTIDGVACPEVLHWSGGTFSASIAASGGKKHVANIGVDPITIEASLPLSPALAACVTDLCTNQSNTKTLQLANFDANGAVVDSPLQARHAQLTEVHVPALDASSRDPFRLTLVFVAEQVRADTAAPKAYVAGRRTPQPSTANFHLSIAHLDTSRVTRIEPFTIARAPATSSVGIAREPTVQTSLTDVPNLCLHFDNVASDDWKAWRDDFFVNGHHLEADEKDGTLQILGVDQRTAIFSLKLSHIGLLHFTSEPDANNLPNRTRVELYCEQMSLGAEAATAPSTSTPPATTPANDTPANVTNSADQGVRDPANFPRPPNTIRTEYSVTNSRALTTEEARYTATSTAEELHTFYKNYFAGAGWSMTELHENDGGPHDVHQIYGNWVAKNNDTVDLRFIDIKPGATEITVVLKRTPASATRT